MNLTSKYRINILKENGFVYKLASGSHQLYYNPTNNKTAVIPVHGGKDMKKGTFWAILKQAGIKLPA